MTLLSPRNRARLAHRRLSVAKVFRQFLRGTVGPRPWLEGGIAKGSLLSLDPPIIYSSFVWPDATRSLWSFGSRFPHQPALMLIYLSWHFTGTGSNRKSLAQLEQYKKAFPLHEVLFLCNAADEVEWFRQHQYPAQLLNHNLTVSEEVYRPLDDIPVTFDAVYNARFDPLKRIDLAFDIERVAYVTQQLPEGDPVEHVRVLNAIQTEHPAHSILNPAQAGRLVSLRAEEVNLAYNRAAVGLCLSPVEGAMLSSMEYMMAGLPIVSTPSEGGRDYFFDPDYTLIVPPDPRQIRDAVVALKARGIPRAYVRAKTLEKVERERAAFLALIDDFLVRQGYNSRFGAQWPWLHRPNLCQFTSMERHVAIATGEATARPVA